MTNIVIHKVVQVKVGLKCLKREKNSFEETKARRLGESTLGLKIDFA